MTNADSGLHVLALNSGSSSLKYGLLRVEAARIDTLLSGDAETPSTESRKWSPRTSVKPGTRLVREWNGQTHTVLVYVDGVEWRDRRYRSLSVVAREITGAHWSGPRFFGLTSKKGAGDG